MPEEEETKKLRFDIRGNLIPAEVIELDDTEFSLFFVEAFGEPSSRTELYQSYLEYTRDLHEVLSLNFFQWIDGSFITKKTNPRDFDLVSFVDYRDFQMSLNLLEERFTSANARTIYGVDAYLVPKYPEGHPRYIFYTSDLLYWRNFFGKTKVNRSKKQFEKGIIQINFQQDESRTIDR